MEKGSNYIFSPRGEIGLFIFLEVNLWSHYVIGITYFLKSNSDMPTADKFIELLLC